MLTDPFLAKFKFVKEILNLASGKGSFRRMIKSRIKAIFEIILVFAGMLALLYLLLQERTDVGVTSEFFGYEKVVCSEVQLLENIDLRPNSSDHSPKSV